MEIKITDLLLWIVLRVKKSVKQKFTTVTYNKHSINVISPNIIAHLKNLKE